VQWLDETDEHDIANLNSSTSSPARLRWVWLFIMPLLVYLGYLFGTNNQTSKPAAIGPFAAAPVPQSTVMQSPSAQNTHSSVTIHVVGEVKKPGVYEFGSNARVRDAVQKAQPKATANLEAINLAAFLEDGKQLVVPGKAAPITATNQSIVRQEVAPRVESRVTVRAGAPRREPRTSKSGTLAKPAAPNKSTLTPNSIDVNTASLEELEQLPGVGPATAQQIVEYREGHNGFGTVDELDEVKGIGPKKLEKLRPFVTVR
jgi:competence protein ComEA